MAEERDKQSIGTRTPYTTPYNLTYGSPSMGIVRGTGADWFGPLNPMHPIAPPDVRGRIFDYQTGYNLSVRPKTEGANGREVNTITFEMLRAFSDAYDLLRLVIETRKDQMARLSWNITTRAHVKKDKDKYKDRIEEIEKFFLRPDKVHFWGDWLRLLLEDLLVLDAPTLHVRRTYGGDLYSLEPLDGGTIKRVIDDWGRTPLPPVAAYQQVLKGYPAVDYTSQELIYKPRNIRTHRVYGFSPVEQTIMTVNIGMRRQTWQLQTFTEGNMPEALIGTPSTWTPDQIASFQNWFDAMLEGNTAERSRAKFVPGEVGKSFIEPNRGELFGAAEEWLARVICFAFSISPQPFLKMMNRATAETAQETAASEGLAPMMGWVKSLMDSIIIDLWGESDLEFEWLDEDELDPNVKSEILDRDTASGRITINESRVASGLDPYEEPDFDRPMFKSAAGWVPIVLTPEEEKEKEAAAAAMAAATGKTPPGDEDGSGGDGEVPPDAGKPGGGGAVPPDTSKPGEVAEKSDRPFDLAKAGKASDSDEVADGGVNAGRKFAAKREKGIKNLFTALFAKAGKDVAKQVEALLKEKKLAKAENSEVDAFLQELDLAVIMTAQDELEEFMAEVFEDSGRIALGIVGTTNNTDLVNQVSKRAVEWSRNHAADLVGANPNSPLAITNSTREMLRGTIADGIEANLSAADIGAKIRDAYAFSEERAELIAFTEITSANSEGSLAGYEEAEEAGVEMGKSWLVLEDGCSICSGNAAAGVIPLDAEFPSGDRAPGAHPKCRCVLVPEVKVEKADQPREPKGSPKGGQFASAKGSLGLGDDSGFAPTNIPATKGKDIRDAVSDSWAAHGAFSSVQELDPSLLSTTQKTVNVKRVQEYIDNPNKVADVAQGRSGNDLVVVKRNGKYSIVDGNHRVSAALISGRKVTAKVTDMDEAYKAAEKFNDGSNGRALTIALASKAKLGKYDGAEDLVKRDATKDMSKVFPVELDKRGPIWAMGGNSDEAMADRASGLQMHVNFEDVVATQDYVDWDKVALYRADPTAKGYDPTVYKFDDDPKFYLQDGHHRAVASKMEGNAGMIMTVVAQKVEGRVSPAHVVQQPRNHKGKFSNDPAHGFMSGTMAPGVPGVRAKNKAVITES